MYILYIFNPSLIEIKNIFNTVTYIVSLKRIKTKKYFCKKFYKTNDASKSNIMEDNVDKNSFMGIFIIKYFLQYILTILKL